MSDEEPEAKDGSEGEAIEFLEDLEKESESIIEYLKEIDEKLETITDIIKQEKFDKNDILTEIAAIRLRIGVIENKGRKEISEEEEVESLLSKIRRWMEAIV